MKYVTFIHIPKTGGTSIRVALENMDDTVFWTGHETAYLKYVNLCSSLGKEDAKKVWDRAFKFTFVRNPWDKAVSHYKYMQQNEGVSLDISFDDWANMMFEPLHLKGRGKYQSFDKFDRRHTNEQVAWYTDLKYDSLVDFVGRFENINEDFQYICDRIGIDRKLPHLNKTEHRPYREYYTPRTRDMLADIAEETIAQFGYTF